MFACYSTSDVVCTQHQTNITHNAHVTYDYCTVYTYVICCQCENSNTHSHIHMLLCCCAQHETNVTVLEDSLRKIQGLQHQAVGMGEISESLVHLDRRIRSEEGRIPSSARRATRDQNVVTKDLKKNMSQKYVHTVHTYICM